MEERSRRRRRAAVTAAGAVLVAGTLAARATRDLPSSAEPSLLEHSSIRGASNLSGGEGRRLGRISDIFHRFYASPSPNDEGDGEEPAVSSGPRPIGDTLPPIGDPLPKDNSGNGSGWGWRSQSQGDEGGASGACSSLSRAECAQSDECKLHRGICVHDQSDQNKAAMRQAAKCARKRKKRCKRTDDCLWDAAQGERGMCVPKGVPQPDDGEGSTGNDNGDKETNGEGQKEKQAKYWPQKVDGGHACVFSDGYPTAYKNVRRPILFDKWEECCAAYSPCVGSDPKLADATEPNVVAVTDPTIDATEPTTGATEQAEPVQPAKCALGTFTDTHSCGPSEYCALNDGACATEGVWWGKCAPLPNREGCSEDYSPVCGCDGFTYGNGCKARAVGVSVKHEGGCGAQEGTETASTPGYATFPTEGATESARSTVPPAADDHATELPQPVVGAEAPHCRESREAPCWYPHRRPDGTKACAYDDLYPDSLFEAATVELFLFPTEEGCCAVYREACPHIHNDAMDDPLGGDGASPPGPKATAAPPSVTTCYPDVRSSVRSCRCSPYPPPLMNPTWFFSSSEECCASWECHVACREERGAPCFYPHLNDDGTKVCRYDGEYPAEYFENEMLRRDFLFGDEDQCCLNFPEACLAAVGDVGAPEEPTATVDEDAATTTHATTANASTEGPHATSGATEPPKTATEPPLAHPACAVGPSATPEMHTCPSTEFCQTSQCADATLQMGSCAPKRVRDECPAEPYDPVCGCDGWTYGNLCSAHAQGVSVRWRGGCGGPPMTSAGATSADRVGVGRTASEPTAGPTGGPTGSPSSAPTPTPSRPPSKAPTPSARCAVGPAVAASPCPEHEYCRLDAGACSAPKAVYYGACAPKSHLCTMEHAPVCGCDGVTYGSDCLAGAAGASVKMVGECPGGGIVSDPISDPTSEFADADAECPEGHCRSPGGHCQPRVECVDDPCASTFCPEDYVCEANSCGGCSASCVPAATSMEAVADPLLVSPYIAVSPDEDPAIYNAPELLVSPAIGALPLPGDSPASDPRFGQQGPTCDVATHEGCSAGQICGTAPGVHCAASRCLPSCHCNYLALGSDGNNGCDVGEVCRRPCAMADAGPTCFKSDEERDCGVYGAGFVCRDGNGDGVIDEKDGTHGCVPAAASDPPGLADDRRWDIGLDERPMRVTGDLEHEEPQGEGAGPD